MTRMSFRVERRISHFKEVRDCHGTEFTLNEANVCLAMTSSDASWSLSLSDSEGLSMTSMRPPGVYSFISFRTGSEGNEGSYTQGDTSCRF